MIGAFSAKLILSNCVCALQHQATHCEKIARLEVNIVETKSKQLARQSSFGNNKMSMFDFYDARTSLDGY
jgi:hypothetical protein